jgi:hypothetical protein
MNRHKSIWEQNQLIASHVDTLDSNIKIIDKAMQGMCNTPKSITVAKKSLRQELNQNAFIIKEALRLHYTLNSMTEDMQMMTFPISDFTRMTDANFYLKASHIGERADAVATELLVLGVSSAKIAKLKTDLQKFYSLPPEREFVAKTNASLVKLIPQKVKDTQLMLRNMLDALVSIYKDEHSDFVISYKICRQRTERPGRKKHYALLIYGDLKDAATSLPLANVKVEAGEKKKPTNTNSNGCYTIKIYKKDANFITFSKEGYQSLTLEIPKEYDNHEVIVCGEMSK